MSALFRKVEGANAVTCRKGVFRQTEVFTRGDGELYAGGGNTFVRLYANGGTSVPTMFVNVLTLECDLFADKFGRLCCTPGEGRGQLNLEKRNGLTLGAP